MFFAVIGHSEDIDADGVLEEVTEQCRGELGDRTPQAGILFASIDMDHELILQGVCDAWSGIELIGCTTDGQGKIECRKVSNNTPALVRACRQMSRENNSIWLVSTPKPDRCASAPTANTIRTGNVSRKKVRR